MTRSALPLLSLCALVLLTSACGGGGDDAPPDVDGGVDAMVDAGPPPDPTLVEVRFDPDGEGFYRMPWPSDARLTPQGTPDLSDFPARRRLVDTTLTEIETHVHGFANMPVAYFALRSPLPEAAMPQGLDALAPGSGIQMLDLSEEGCGERFPLEVAFADDGDAHRDDHMLEVANAIGTRLLPGRPYGVVLLRTLGARQGLSTPRPPAFDAALRDEAGTTALSASLAPLRRCLPSAGVALDEVAVATVFTPQDPVAETLALRDYVSDPDVLETKEVAGWRVADGWSRRRLALTTYRGVVQMPMFQDGETPYTTEGGSLVFDDEGVPVLQRWEEVDIAVAMRDFETPPAGPRPVLVFLDGTGWEPWQHLPDNWIREAMDAGYVVMSFMPQFHGGRAGFMGQTEVSTFNVPNPPAGRGNFRQQAAELVYFARLVRERIAGLPGLPALDTDHLVYGGHSQGALVGALVAGVDDSYDAYVLNGLSAFLTLTILYREDFFDFADVISLIYAFGGTLDRHHPLLQILQLGAEVTDTHNYVSRWHGWPENPDGNHVFVVNGFADATTTPRGIDHLMMTADMPPIDPPGWDHDPVGFWSLPPVTMPVTGNEMAESGADLTLATYTDPTGGHGTIYARRFARELAVGFWNTARGTEAPLLASRAEYLCDDGADGDQDDLVDCDDPDCARIPPCGEASCSDEMDDDGDGDVDCADADCAGDRACDERNCGNGRDDDGDGLVDCDDPGCGSRAPCAEGSCDDGMDGDADGDVDCDDLDCARSAACFEGRCDDGMDNDGDGAVDCDDPDCHPSPLCGERSCTDGTDDDGNGLGDCEDPTCLGDEACPRAVETACDDGADDDDDGAIDCADADCARATTCAATTCADGHLGGQMGAGLFAADLSVETHDYPPGDCIALGAGYETPDVAVAWTAPAAGDYVFSTKGSAVDTILSVLPADCDPVAELACNDDESPLATSALTLRVEEGQTVVVVIGAYDPEVDLGEVRLHIWPVPGGG